MACLGLAKASLGLAWTSQGLALAFQGLARAFHHLAWASLGLAQASGWADEWMDRQTDGWMDKFALSGIIGHGPLWGRCPIDYYSKPNQQMGQKVPLTM